jgi:Zn-dependent protease with chaperone function
MRTFSSTTLLWRFSFYILTILSAGTPTFLSAQSATATPHFSSKDSLVRLDLAKQVAASVEKTFVPPARFDKATKGDYLKNREMIAAEVSDEIAQLAIPDVVLWPFLQKVHANIAAANPTVKNTRVILISDPTPNAYSIGDGTFVVHVGLLAGLETEDQLAFVLCHEMAHYLLEHATKGLEKRVEELNSKAFKEKMKKLEEQEYNRYAQMEAVFQNMLFNNRYHSRNHERQSDSLAFHLYTRTNYELRQSERLMEVFESIDEPFRDSVLRFSTQFGCAQQPFRDTWLAGSGGSIWADARQAQAEANKIYRDSISTHPDWENRLEWLKKLTKLPPPTSPVLPNVAANYANIRFQAALECVEAWASFKRYDRALFLALHYQKVYPECRYFREMECLALYQLYQFTKDHNVAKVLAQSADKYPEKYNQFLDFLNALRMKELLGLADCSLARLPAEKGEYGLLAAYQLALAKSDKTTAAALKQTYQKQFSDGRFHHFFYFTK